MRLVYFNIQKISTNIHKVHRNSKWKYPNKFSNFVFYISNFTQGFYDISKSDRSLGLHNN